MSDHKSFWERMRKPGALALAGIFFVASAGGGYFSGKYRSDSQTKPVIVKLEERGKDQQEIITTLRSNNEALQGIVSEMGGHGAPIQHVLNELREHPPANEEMERILEGLSAQEQGQAINPILDECCRREYETIKGQFNVYRLSRDKDLGLRIQVGLLWLHKGCGRKLNEVSTLSEDLRRK